MAKENISDLSSDEELEEGESSEKLSEEEEEEEEEAGIPNKNVAKEVIAGYEQQRLSRMAENKARMEALGLQKLASSLMGSAQPRKSMKSKGKRKLVEEDDDYQPNDDDASDDQDDDDEDEDENDEDFVGNSYSKSRRNKAKNKGSKPKKKVTFRKHFSGADYIDEDDDELMQAIALSLQDSSSDATFKERLENTSIQEDAGRQRTKKSFSNRVQMTEDELILHFFQFDESGRGFLTVRDLERVATTHDFTWTDKELVDMVHCFDSDGDRKLNLDDFRKIAVRCNMIQRSENC